MTGKITFKQYLESKNQLKRAIANTPVAVMEYEITKYCQLTVGDVDDKDAISLKPRHKLVVEWRYDDIDNPTPQCIQVLGEDAEYETFWTGVKLQKWLTRQAKQGENRGHKT